MSSKCVRVDTDWWEIFQAQRDERLDVALVCQEHLQLSHGICLNLDQGYELLPVNLVMRRWIGPLRSPRGRHSKRKDSAGTSFLVNF